MGVKRLKNLWFLEVAKQLSFVTPYQNLSFVKLVWFEAAVNSRYSSGKEEVNEGAWNLNK